jgi:hypothetical protein
MAKKSQPRMAKLRVKERLVVRDGFSEEDVEAAIISCHSTDYYVLFNYMKEDDVEPRIKPEKKPPVPAFERKRKERANRYG